MTDANTQFFAILTSVGKAKQANADALGIPWLITQMGVGDANNIDPVIPAEGQTKLINEWRRRPLNRLFVDPVNPAVLIAEQVIPADEGGKWIREIGLYDADGDLVAVANCAPSFKPLLSQGSGRTQIVRMNFIVTSTGNIQLKIDPAVVLATRAFVEAAILEVLPKNKTPGQWTRVKTNDRGIVVEGDNPSTLAEMGIQDGCTKGELDSAVQLLSVARATAGESRNALMIVSAPSMTATWRADELVVKTTLGGLAWPLSAVAVAVDLASNGAGGMDVGAPPANGYLAIYAIYNPVTKVTKGLAVNATSAVAPEVCVGKVPAGYTASALVAVVPTDASGKIKTVTVEGRNHRIILGTYYALPNQVTNVPLSIAGVVPLNAKTHWGELGLLNANGGAMTINLATGNEGVGQVNMTTSVTAGTLLITNYPPIAITTPQMVNLTTSTNAGAPTFYAHCTGYSI